MNKKLQELLSAYLDDQLTPAERALVESRLAQDATARNELAALKSLKGMLDQSTPAPVKAPPELRAVILARLKAAPPASGGSSHGGTGSALGGKALGLGGAVLLGLLGTFVYLDQHYAQHGSAPTQQPIALNTTATPAAGGWQPAWGRPAPTPATANAAEIQTLSSVAPNVQASSAPGEVFTIGQGGARAKNALPNLGQPVPSTYQLTNEPGKAPELEDAAGNLNPALLACAVQEFPDRTPEELGSSLRASLAKSLGRPYPERLQRLLHDLGADPARSKEWDKRLR